MLYTKGQSRSASRGGGVTARAVPASLLLACALLPAISLAIFRHVPTSLTGLGTSTLLVLLVILPLASFLLAVMLWHARQRIHRLEQDKAAVAGQIDPLTSLPDRLAFERILVAEIERSTDSAPLALVAIDIDRFKSVNDTHGHQAGDRLIVGIVERIRRVIRETDCLARIGGDEFALVLPRAAGMSECSAAAHRILDAMIAPFDLGFAQIHATLSLGIALAPRDGHDRETLGQAADLALYRAKHEGRNRFAFFDKTMEQKLHLGQTIEGDLRRAIVEQELSIAYQPLIEAQSGRTSAVEALVRWQHPKLGWVPPEDFIPLAESRGLIVPLGEWVLRKACIDARRWPNLRVAVNVSPVQFRQRDFLQRVETIIAETGIDPKRLDFELTEGVLIQDAEQAETVIVELRALGIRMGLDDFGSGYSSMIYLRRFAFDKVKIDRALLQALETSGEGAIILEYIVSLGHALGLRVTAEGVEDAEQVEFLRKIGCDELQGYHYAAPMSVREIDERVSLEEWTAKSEARDGLDVAAGRDAA